ncbi:MAG: MBL fold metallo-hydrolase [Desulfomonilaceae bacterium]|nr:MBL fold metallo-hydrolase [Desulfomonilaceae bacterium]
MSLRMAGLLLCVSVILCAPVCALSQQADVIKGASGDLKVILVGHGSVILEFGGKVVHVDPFGKVGDYDKLPKADLILITHEHGDHLDPAAIAKVRTEKTVVVSSEAAARGAKADAVMKNGDTRTELGFKIEAVAAYNIVHKRDTGEPFHPKGRGNGYVITFGDLRVYVAGDTENIPEMKDLEKIDVAFLPVNLPYTMTGKMAAEAAKTIKPKYLYPYHYAMGKSQLPEVLELMKGVDGTEIRGVKK